MVHEWVIFVGSNSQNFSTREHLGIVNYSDTSTHRSGVSTSWGVSVCSMVHYPSHALLGNFASSHFHIYMNFLPQHGDSKHSSFTWTISWGGCGSRFSPSQVIDGRSMADVRPMPSNDYRNDHRFVVKVMVPQWPPNSEAIKAVPSRQSLWSVPALGPQRHSVSAWRFRAPFCDRSERWMVNGVWGETAISWYFRGPWGRVFELNWWLK
jgi:hypothetical protein